MKEVFIKEVGTKHITLYDIPVTLHFSTTYSLFTTVGGNYLSVYRSYGFQMNIEDALVIVHPLDTW